MKRIVSLLMLAIIVINLTALESKFPNVSSLKENEEYSKYESLALNAIDFLQQTPINENQEMRKKMNTFILKWVIEHP